MNANIPNVAPFNGKNDFSIWKQKMRCILVQQKLVKALDHSYAATDTEAKRAEMNEMAKSSIILNLSDFVIRKVGELDTAQEMWETLEKLYTETSFSSRMYLLEKLFKFKLDMSKDIDENMDCFTKLVQDIKRSGDTTIDNYTNITLMNAIPDSYNDVKSAIKYGRDSASVDVIVNALKSKELDMSHGNGNSGDKVMNVRGRPKSRSNEGNQKKRGKSRYKSRMKGRKCYNCQEIGHYAKQCTNPKKPRNKHENNNESVNVASGNNMGDCYMIESACYSRIQIVDDHLRETQWLMDSGCSFHICPYLNMFADFTNLKDAYVSLADGYRRMVTGIGTIHLKFENGTLYTLKNVRCVSDLCHNFMSFTALEDDGLEGKWGNGQMKIIKGSMILFKAARQDKLYVCHATPIPASDYKVNYVHPDKAVLWHNRLGHMCNKGLEILKKDGVFGKDIISPITFCEACVLGKQHKVQFPMNPSPNMSKCTAILEYVHVDVWGPASELTHGGNRYFYLLLMISLERFGLC